MNLLKKAFLALGASAIAFAPFAALAENYFDAVHKWTDSANGKTYVYVPSPPGVPVPEFTFPKAPKDRILTLNNCGWGSFTKSATSPPTNITGANWAGKTSGAAPTCTKAVAPATGYVDSNSSAATGTIIDDGTKLWVKGGAGPGSVTLQITTVGTITTKTNACGFLRVAVSATRPMTTFNIGANNYALADLPVASAPMICRKIGDTSITYGPL